MLGKASTYMQLQKINTELGLSQVEPANVLTVGSRYSVICTQDSSSYDMGIFLMAAD